MNTENLSGLQAWQAFEQENQLEQRVYNLTLKALKLIKDELIYQPINAFAFCADSYYGDLSISYNVYDGKMDGDVLKEKYYYPSKWTHEVDERLEKLVEEEFRQIVGDKIFQIQEQAGSGEFSDDFAEAFLNALRKVMAKLEKDGAFLTLSTTDKLWLVVTEIDADAIEEDRKLNEARSFMVKSI